MLLLNKLQMTKESAIDYSKGRKENEFEFLTAFHNEQLLSIDSHVLYKLTNTETVTSYECSRITNLLRLQLS